MSGSATGADRTVERIHCREFRLSDAMILLAGAALALSAGSHLLLLLADMLGRLFREAAAHRATCPNTGRCSGVPPTAP